MQLTTGDYRCHSVVHSAAGQEASGIRLPAAGKQGEPTNVRGFSALQPRSAGGFHDSDAIGSGTVIGRHDPTLPSGRALAGRFP